MMRCASCLLLFFFLYAVKADQIDAVRGLVRRVLASDAAALLFDFRLVGGLPAQGFRVTGNASSVVIEGSSGVQLASGFNWYLKYVLNGTYLWQEERIPAPFPSPLPRVSFQGAQNVDYVYYQNVCTLGYTFPFFSWARWEREIDWMAMNGIDFPLAFVGQEYVWERVFAQLGIPMEEVRASWIAGQEFLPWNRMGNINNWHAEPMTEELIVQQAYLQKKIVTRMRQFGMRTILPGFAGHVPPNFAKYFPNASVSQLSWGSDWSPTLFLDPLDPLFARIGAIYTEVVSRVYGTDHFYNADPFNEMTPRQNTTAYLAAVSRAIYSAMATTDPNATWVLQGWFLV